MAPKRNMLPCQDNALNTLIKNIRINFVRLIIVLKGLILKVRVLKIYATLTFCTPEKIVFACQFNSYTYSAGGSETRLGKWEKWEDELYNVQLYEHGVQCWNGPQRSTRVVMRCGLRNALVASTEPNRCEYKFVFETPALCKAQDIMTDESMGDGHDEL